MELENIFLIVFVCMAVIALIIFLIWRNRRDQKSLNPDAPDSVEETHMDKDRRADRM